MEDLLGRREDQSSDTCKNCHGENIYTDPKTGHSSCEDCGVISSSPLIDNSVQFAENSSGGTSAVGTFISMHGSTLSRESQGIGYDKELSREQRMAAGRRRLLAMAAGLNIANTIVDKAHRLLLMAINMNFIKGRRTQHVIAACMYIATRREKLGYMLGI